MIRKYPYAPKFLIIPGSLYIDDFSLLTEKNCHKLYQCRKYLGENYASFRINNKFEDGWFLRSAVYTKLPALILQFDEYCEIIEFMPSINKIPLTVGLQNSDNNFSVKIFFHQSEIKLKDTLHLGEWQRSEKINMPDADIEAATKTIKCERWYDYIFNRINKFDKKIEIKQAILKDTVTLAFDFLNKIYNSKHHIHCEFIEPVSTKFGLHKKTYCLPTYEFSRLYFLSRADKTRSLNFYSENIEKLLELIFIDLKEINCGITHNTIGIDDYNNIYPHTQFNTGLAGYPGGVASDLIYILLFYTENKIVPLNAVSEKLKKMIGFLEYLQNDNFQFSYSLPCIPANEELFYKCQTGRKNITVGGTAAAAFAYYLWFKLTNEKKYLDLSVNTINSILPDNDYFFVNSFGLLRDGGYMETDGVSVYYIFKTLTGLNRENIDYSCCIKKLTAYIFQWHYWNNDLLNFASTAKQYEKTIFGAVDPMTDSFSPRIGGWDLLLWSEMYLDAYSVLKEKKYLELALFCFDKARLLQNKFCGGIPESIGINYDWSLNPININNGVSVWLIELSKRISDYVFGQNINITGLPITDTLNKNIEIRYAAAYSKPDYKKILKNILKIIPVKFKIAAKQIIRKFFSYSTLENKNSGQQFSYSGCQNNTSDNIVPCKIKSLKSLKTIINQSAVNIELPFFNKYRNVIFLAAPVVYFKNTRTIEILRVTRNRGCIKQLDLVIDSSEKYFITFNYGLPVNYFTESNYIYFDYTVKCRCNDSGIIKQSFDIQKTR